MSRKMIALMVVVAGSLPSASAFAQDCPDLGLLGQEICVVASAGTSGTMTFRGASPLTVGPVAIGDYTVNLTYTLSPGAGLAIGVMGMVTKTGTENTTVTLTAHGGLAAGPLGDGVKALNLVGTATGTSLIQLGGGAGYDIGVGEPQIDPVLGSVSAAVLNNTGLPLGFGATNPGEPAEAGAVSVALTLAVNINEMGDVVMVPASAGVGPEGLVPDEPIGGPTEILRLRVSEPDGPFEIFPLDEFRMVGPDECPSDHFHAAFVFAESLEGTQLDDMDPGACGYGTTDDLEVETIELVAEDTTLTEDLVVPDGNDLVIASEATLTIPEDLAAYVSGDVEVLGTLVVNGEMLNAEGGVLVNKGEVIVDGLIVNNPDAMIQNLAGATITNNSNTINNYGTIDNQGTIDNAGRITNEPGGTLAGEGQVTGNAIQLIVSDDGDEPDDQEPVDGDADDGDGEDGGAMDGMIGVGGSGGASAASCGACGGGSGMALIGCMIAPFLRTTCNRRRVAKR